MNASMSFGERKLSFRHNDHMGRRPVDTERGKRIRDLRERLSFGSQTAFAAVLSAANPKLPNISRGAVGNWEQGKDIAVDNARRIAAFATERGIPTGIDWIYDGIEADDDRAADAVVVPGIVDVPRVTWVTAGELGSLDAFDPVEMDDYPTITAADLPAGRYIALKVEADGNSMNKISPPESVIFVNLDDRRLVPNACYVVADEQGRATYKRYRPGAKPEFQPASYEAVKPPKLEGAITVIGRVRRSMIDM